MTLKTNFFKISLHNNCNYLFLVYCISLLAIFIRCYEIIVKIRPFNIEVNKTRLSSESSETIRGACVREKQLHFPGGRADYKRNIKTRTILFKRPFVLQHLNVQKLCTNPINVQQKRPGYDFSIQSNILYH